MVTEVRYSVMPSSLPRHRYRVVQSTTGLYVSGNPIGGTFTSLYNLTPAGAVREALRLRLSPVAHLGARNARISADQRKRLSNDLLRAALRRPFRGVGPSVRYTR